MIDKESKACGRCPAILPLSSFGINRRRSDGRSLYCPDCVREKTKIFREQERAGQAARKRMVMAKTPAVRVRVAIEAGARSYFEIARKARLGTDTVGDALAELMLEQKVVKSEIVNGTRQYFLRRAA